MTFNAGKYTATSTNQQKTTWKVESADGERFIVTDKKVGAVANLLVKKTIKAAL